MFLVQRHLAHFKKTKVKVEKYDKYSPVNAHIDLDRPHEETLWYLILHSALTII